MRVLVVHNHYQSRAPSGENLAVHRDVDLLKTAGYDVQTYYAHSDDITSPKDKAMAALGPLYSPSGVAGFKKMLLRFRPDVVHVHNLNPLISPAVIGVADAADIAIVQTLHNYRHGCLNGLHFRDGRVCTDCLGRRVKTPGLRHACYRDSRPASMAVAAGDLAHARTWRKVDRFIALTPFMVDLATRAGIPGERLVLRPSFTHDPGPAAVGGRSRTVVYAGRLDPAKGLHILMDAWSKVEVGHGWKLMVAGSGPLAGLVRDTARERDDLEYLGTVQPDELSHLMHKAVVSVVPSIAYEGFPLVVTEAMAHGLAVAACRGTSTVSAVPVAAGWVLAPDVDTWARFLRDLDLTDARSRGAAARQFFLDSLTPGKSLERIKLIYQEAVGARRGRRLG